MKCKVYSLNTLKEYKYVVCFSLYQGKLLLSKHKKRDTYETQGGHIELGETPLEAAKRELYEESGATEFNIVPLCDYYAEDENSHANGMVFVVEIKKLENMPESEMEKVQLFDTLPNPDYLTYPGIISILERRKINE